MCWVLYLACDQPLPLQPFDREAPAFNVAELTPHEEPVRGQFSKPYVYRVGAHTLCGCGFDRGQAHPDHPEELETTEASLRSLHAYLRDALEACRTWSSTGAGTMIRVPYRTIGGIVGCRTSALE